MSNDLYWEPARRKRRSLPIGLKWKLEKKLFSGTWGPVTVDAGDIPYLEGLRDAEIDGAQELIDAIEKHDEVELRIKE